MLEKLKKYKENICAYIVSVVYLIYLLYFVEKVRELLIATVLYMVILFILMMLGGGLAALNFKVSTEGQKLKFWRNFKDSEKESSKKGKKN